MVTNYQTKKAKITAYLRKVIKDLETSAKDNTELSYLTAVTALDLGVSESEVLEVLKTFENAKVLKINEKDNIVLIY